MRKVTVAKAPATLRKPTSKLGSARRTRSFIRQFLTFFSSFIVIAILGTGIWMYHSGHSISKWAMEGITPLVTLTGTMGLTFQEVYIEGKLHTQNDQILAALDVKIGQPILGIPLWQAKERLEKIDWVKRASVERRLPHTLYIRLIEREPLALWQKEKKLYLLDEEGHSIAEKDLKPFSHLLVIVGDDVLSHIQPLLAMLKKEPELYNQVASAIRVSKRRWNIRFTGGIEAKLPERGAEEAWRRLSELNREKKLFSQGIATIDLRLAEKIYMKMSPAAEDGEQKPESKK